MKNLLRFAAFALLVLTAACNKKENAGSMPDPNDPNNPTNSPYDFYVHRSGNCIGNSILTKNYTDTLLREFFGSFKLIENDLYTFGLKQYRNATGNEEFNYSAYLQKNGTVVEENFGGGASAVLGIVKAGNDLWYNTGFASGVGQTSMSALSTRSIIWKTGVPIDTLAGPFNSVAYNGDIGGPVAGKFVGVQTEKLFMHNGDTYVGGKCTHIGYGTGTGEGVSFGYWKNGDYVEVRRIPGADVVFDPQFCFEVADNGDVYYLVGNDGYTLYRNGSVVSSGLTDGESSSPQIMTVGSDYYILASRYSWARSRYEVEIYKNGAFLLNTPGYSGGGTLAVKMATADGKVFLAKDDTSSTYPDYRSVVYEVQGSSLIKVCTSPPNMCSDPNIPGFQVIKR